MTINVSMIKCYRQSGADPGFSKGEEGWETFAYISVIVV